MIFDRLINIGKERGLLYSGLAAGAMHMFVAVVALCLAINGIQKSSTVTIIHLMDGELNDAPQSLLVQQKPVSPAVTTAQTKAIRAVIKETVRDVAAETPTKPQKTAEGLSVSVGPIRPAAVQTIGAQVNSGVSSGQPADVKFGDSSGLNFRHREMPVYPFAARQMNIEGDLLLRLTIDERGRLLNVEALKPAAFGFTEAALEAIRNSTFVPARKNGVAVKSRALWSVRFRLTGKDDN